MIDLISSVDALFSYLGATLFILGLLSCIIPRHFRLGVIALLIADVPLILVIASPKKLAEFMLASGIKPEEFPDINHAHTIGICVGIIIFVVLFMFYRFVLKWHIVKPKTKEQEASKKANKANKAVKQEPDAVAAGDLEPILTESTDTKDSKEKGFGLFKKKSYTSASARHLSSQDIPLALEPNSGSSSEANGTNFSLSKLSSVDGNAPKEPTLGAALLSDVEDKREPSFGDENQHGSATHPYGVKPLEQKTSRLHLASAEDKASAANASAAAKAEDTPSLSSLLAKLNKLNMQQNAATKDASAPKAPLDTVEKLLEPKVQMQGLVLENPSQQMTRNSNVDNISPIPPSLEGKNIAGARVSDLLKSLDDEGNSSLKLNESAKSNKLADDEASEMSFAVLLQQSSQKEQATKFYSAVESSDDDVDDDDASLRIDYEAEARAREEAEQRAHLQMAALAKKELERLEKEKQAQQEAELFAKQQEAMLKEQEKLAKQEVEPETQAHAQQQGFSFSIDNRAARERAAQREQEQAQTQANKDNSPSLAHPHEEPKSSEQGDVNLHKELTDYSFTISSHKEPPKPKPVEVDKKLTDFSFSLTSSHSIRLDKQDEHEESAESTKQEESKLEKQVAQKLQSVSESIKTAVVEEPKLTTAAPAKERETPSSNASRDSKSVEAAFKKLDEAIGQMKQRESSIGKANQAARALQAELSQELQNTNPQRDYLLSSERTDALQDEAQALVALMSKQDAEDEHTLVDQLQRLESDSKVDLTLPRLQKAQSAAKHSATSTIAKEPVKSATKPYALATKPARTSASLAIKPHSEISNELKVQQNLHLPEPALKEQASASLSLQPSVTATTKLKPSAVVESEQIVNNQQTPAAIARKQAKNRSELPSFIAQENRIKPKTEAEQASTKPVAKATKVAAKSTAASAESKPVAAPKSSASITPATKAASVQQAATKTAAKLAVKASKKTAQAVPAPKPTSAATTKSVTQSSAPVRSTDSTKAEPTKVAAKNTVATNIVNEAKSSEVASAKAVVKRVAKPATSNTEASKVATKPNVNSEATKPNVSADAKPAVKAESAKPVASATKAPAATQDATQAVKASVTTKATAEAQASASAVRLGRRRVPLQAQTINAALSKSASSLQTTSVEQAAHSAPAQAHIASATQGGSNAVAVHKEAIEPEARVAHSLKRTRTRSGSALASSATNASNSAELSLHPSTETSKVIQESSSVEPSEGKIDTTSATTQPKRASLRSSLRGRGLSRRTPTN